MWGRRRDSPEKSSVIESVPGPSATRELRKFSEELLRSRKDRLRHLEGYLREAQIELDLLTKIEDALSRPKSQNRRFLISSLFLRECYKELTADSKEQLLFISGPETENAFILDQKCTFDHLSRTAVGVEGDMKSTHRLLCDLEESGHKLLAHFHSHPGKGISATLPSSIDLSFQERLQRGGYPTVAAIFSRDGFVRFFRLNEQVAIEIYGKGVEKVEAKVFQVTESN